MYNQTRNYYTPNHMLRIFSIWIFVATVAIGSVGYLSSNDSAMKTCLQKHSQATCANALR